MFTPTTIAVGAALYVALWLLINWLFPKMPKARDCYICTKLTPLAEGGTVTPADRWICNGCLRNLVCP